MLGNDENADTLVSNEEMLILDVVGEELTKVKYIAVYQKVLYECEISAETRKTSRTNITYGSVLNGEFLVRSSQNVIIVRSIKSIYLVSRAKASSQWAQLGADFSPKTGHRQISCKAFTAGCFSYLNIDYSTPCVYNNVLGIIVDDDEEPRLPRRQIGYLECYVNTKQIKGNWYFVVKKLKKFEKVRSLVMSLEEKLEEKEHFGLVTREECDNRRDLRLVSCRDFPRDVRIFKSGSHCCVSADSNPRHHKRHHNHNECVSSGLGDEVIIGKSVSIKMKKCSGMNSQHELIFPSTTAKGSHVDAKSLKIQPTQLPVDVHVGFVEVETISEFSGYTDHSGYPLLWSHDVEFVVDFSKVFASQPFGLYVVKVVRFHRENVFAKWRLARRQPIVRALPTRFHNNLARSLNWEEPKTQRRDSFSRFGSGAQSCCLPRTDSLDKIELFDALIKSVSISCQEEPIIDDFKDDEEMWKHHNCSALKIVEEANPDGNGPTK